MQQVIYVDVLIVLNILITYLLLLAASHILRTEPSSGRMLMGCFLGGIYSLVILAPDFGVPASIIIKLILSISIVSVTYKPRSLSALVRCIVSFFSINFIFAGVMLAVFIVFKPGGMEFRNGALYLNFSFFSIIAAAIVCYFVVFIFNRVTKQNAPDNRIYDISIGIFGRETEGKGLLDTGNSLTDGFMGAPVIVVRRNFVMELLPPELSAYFDGDFDMSGGKIPREWSGRIRVVPAVTVNATALLPSFRPDYVTIDGNRASKHVLVAVCPDNKLDMGYDCLINAELIGGFEKEKSVIS